MREKVTGTEYFMALSLARSEGPQPRAGPDCVCQGALALTVQEMRQEQSPQPGGELLTGIDEPSYLGTAHRCHFFFFFLLFQAEYLLFASTFWFLETSIEKGACSSHHRLTSQATWMERKSGEGGKWRGPPVSSNFTCLTHSEAKQSET